MESSSLSLDDLSELAEFLEMQKKMTMIKFNNGSYEPQNTREVVLGLIKEF